jgi:hypothetical protein
MRSSILCRIPRVKEQNRSTFEDINEVDIKALAAAVSFVVSLCIDESCMGRNRRTDCHDLCLLGM